MYKNLGWIFIFLTSLTAAYAEDVANENEKENTELVNEDEQVAVSTDDSGNEE